MGITTPLSTVVGIAEVERLTGHERSTISRWVRAGRFPKPFYLGERREWLLGEIEAWRTREMGRPVEERHLAKHLRQVRTA